MDRKQKEQQKLGASVQNPKELQQGPTSQKFHPLLMVAVTFERLAMSKSQDCINRKREGK